MINRCRRAAMTVLTMAALGVAVSAQAADDKAAKKDEHAGHEHDAASMQPPTLAPEHAVFQQLAGKWKAVNKMMMGPGTEPMITEGIEEVTVICNGLFIKTMFKSGAPMPFEGHGIEGYDLHKKKYTGTWVDSMGSAVYSYEGTRDAKGVFTSVMSGPDPMTGKPWTSTMVCDSKDANTRTMKMYMGTDTSVGPMMEITYTRM